MKPPLMRISHLFSVRAPWQTLTADRTHKFGLACVLPRPKTYAAAKFARSRRATPGYRKKRVNSASGCGPLTLTNSRAICAYAERLILLCPVGGLSTLWRIVSALEGACAEWRGRRLSPLLDRGLSMCSQRNAQVEFPELTIDSSQPVLQLDISVHIEGRGISGIREREGWPLDVFAHVRSK